MSQYKFMSDNHKTSKKGRPLGLGDLLISRLMEKRKGRHLNLDGEPIQLQLDFGPPTKGSIPNSPIPDSPKNDLKSDDSANQTGSMPPFEIRPIPGPKNKG